MFQNLKVMSLEECTVFLSCKITNFFKVELLMSLTIQDLTILFHCAMLIRLLFLLLMLYFWSAGVYYDRLYFSKALKGNYVVTSCLTLL